MLRIENAALKSYEMSYHAVFRCWVFTVTARYLASKFRHDMKSFAATMSARQKYWPGFRNDFEVRLVLNQPENIFYESQINETTQRYVCNLAVCNGLYYNVEISDHVFLSV